MPDLLEPRLDTTRGGRSDVTLKSGTQTAQSTTITFSRPLVTGDINDFDIKMDGAMYLLYAFAPDDNTATIHPPGAYGSGLVNFADGTVTVPTQSLILDSDPGIVLFYTVNGIFVFYLLFIHF